MLVLSGPPSLCLMLVIQKGGKAGKELKSLVYWYY